MTPTLCVSGDGSQWQKWDQAGAQAYYACRYFAAIEDTNLWRNVIALIQQATQFYFADKQYEIAVEDNKIKKQQQDRLDSIADIDIGRSGEIHGQFSKGIACEDAMRDAACNIDVTPPNRDDIRRRVTADVTRTFSAAKAKIRRCYPVNCAAAMCSELRKLAQREAAAIAATIEATWQKETALYEQRKATARSWQYQVLALARGSFAASTALMQGAAAATQAASQIAYANPYGGYIQAVNGAANTLRSMTLQEANGFAGMGINMRGQQGIAGGGGTQLTTGSFARMDGAGYRGDSISANVGMGGSGDMFDSGWNGVNMPSDGTPSGEPMNLNTNDWNPLQNMG
jgi:hypothetical protein